MEFDFFKQKESKEDNKIFDPQQYAEELVFEQVPDSVLDSIDESDLPIPANFLEAVVGKKFLSGTILPRQIQIGSLLHGDICPHCSNPKAINNLYDQKLGWIYDNVMFMRNGVCPKCKRTRLDLYKEELFNYPNACFVCAGQRSGKSILSGGLLAHYQNMRFNTMTNKKGKRVIPYKYFHNPPAPLYGTFTAVNLGQAYKNLWDPFKGYLSSPWYTLYFEILDYYGKKLGIELYKNTTTFLQFNHKKLGWLCEPPDKKTLRGKTRFYFDMDELDWHDLDVKDDSKRGSAKEVMAAGRNSLVTVRRKSLKKLQKGCFNVPTGLECYVSSPAEANGILLRKIRESKRNTSMLGFHYATWEFNPDFSSPEDIGESDPMILARDFGAKPPLADSPFYNDSKNLVGLIGKRTGLAEYEVLENKNSYGEINIYPKLGKISYSNTYPKILTLDNGQVNNCFSACISHLEKNVVVNDFLVTVKPSKSRKINLSKCFDDFVLPIVNNKSFNIVMVSYDRWNSSQAIDSLKDSGVFALQYSIKYSDFLEIRSGLSSGLFEFCNPSMDVSCLVTQDSDLNFVEISNSNPYFGLLYEILTVRDLGRTLSKPTNGDDDIFRAWALGCALIKKEEYKKMFSEKGNISAGSDRALGSFGMLGSGRKPSCTGNASLGSVLKKSR